MDKNFNEFFDELNDMANFKNFGEKEETEQKEIIIDGVNVAGCVRLQDDKTSCDLGGECKGWDNCYYKQLKRLQQDYVNLSKSFEHLKTSYQENQDYISQLKDENAELKEKIKKYAAINEQETKDYAELKAENERLKEKMIRLTEENGNLIIRANTSYNNYRDTQRRLDELCKANIHNLALLSKANKTLQEIKAIVTEPCIDNEDCLTCKSNCMNKDILDLITKAGEE